MYGDRDMSIESGECKALIEELEEEIREIMGELQGCIRDCQDCQDSQDCEVEREER